MIEPVGHSHALVETAFPAAGSRFATMGCRPRQRLVRHRLGSRWLAERASEPAPVMVYLLREPLRADGFALVKTRLQAAMAFRHPHALPVVGMDLAPDAGPCLLSPYPGTLEGLCTVAQALAASSGGRLEVFECRIAAEQILGALVALQQSDIPHGPVRIDEVLIDGRGRIMLELAGVEAALGAGPSLPLRERLALETLAVVRLVYELVTGVTVARPSLPAGRLVQRLPRAWSRWLDSGLEPSSGYADASEALAALPDW